MTFLWIVEKNGALKHRLCTFVVFTGLNMLMGITQRVQQLRRSYADEPSSICQKNPHSNP